MLSLPGPRHKATSLRSLIKLLHPEGIPWPGTVLYDRLSRTKIFRQHYALVAEDVKRYGSARHLFDVGAGPGWLLIALRQAIPNLELVGIDVSPSMVGQTSQNLRRQSLPSEIEPLVRRLCCAREGYSAL